MKACNILCAQGITLPNLELADSYLKAFCQKHEELFGKEMCTINMHLHLHLKECIAEFGPSPVFWCFSFESVLGSYPTNNKSAEEQFMKRFLREQNLKSYKEYDFLDSQLMSLVNSMQSGEVNVADTSYAVCDGVRTMNLSTTSLPVQEENLCFALASKNSSCQFISPFTEKVFTPDSYKRLSSFYHQLYPKVHFAQIPRFFQCIKKVVMFGQPITSVLSASEVSNVVMAIWSGHDFSVTKKCIGQIQYFIQHTVSCIIMGKVEKFEHTLAFVKWYKEHEHSNWFGSSVVVSQSQFEPDSVFHQYIPIQRILCRCAYGSNSSEVVHVSSPISLNYAI